MKKQYIKTDAAPKAIGPYSQGVKGNGFLFVSGQLPVHPVTGEIPESVEDQTLQSLSNVKAVLEAGGSKVPPTVKTRSARMIRTAPPFIRLQVCMHAAGGRYKVPSPPAKHAAELCCSHVYSC